jgi:hypothetical protein
VNGRSPGVSYEVQPNTNAVAADVRRRTFLRPPPRYLGGYEVS